jgi:phenylalanyl-tRNA synthetase beta chain
VNLRHGTADVAVFEIGKGYGRTGDAPREWWRLAFALTGLAEDAAWNRAPRPYDLDDAKGVVELLARRLDFARPSYDAEPDEPLFHPGRTARVRAGADLLGIVGEVHPAIVKAWELRTTGRVIVAELAVAGLAGGRLAPERAPSVTRFPDTERDLAVVVPEATAAAAVERVVVTASGPLLRAIELFDIYRGVPLAPDEKSLAYRLAFASPDRTLTEDEIDGVVAAIVAAVGDIGGRIRA